MRRTVTFGSAARAELLDALDWYETHVPGVSRHFLEEVDAAVRRIADNPMQFPAVHRDIRRARLRRFPYAVFFRVADHDVQVIACFHSNRDPRRWQRRV